jgi:hypothetical protein
MRTMIIFLLLTTNAYALQPYTYLRSLEFKARVTAEVAKREPGNKAENVNRELYNIAKKEGLFISVCAYCNTVMDVNIGEPALSHGICPGCLEHEYAVMGCLEALPKDWKEKRDVELWKRGVVAEGMA